MARKLSSRKEQNGKDSTAVQSSVPLTHSCSFPSSWTLQETRGFQSKYFHLTMVAHLVPSWPDHVAVWTARRHRKGNLPYMMPVGSEAAQVPSSPLRSLFAPFGYRLVGWEPSDISFWVAQCFIWGSVLFVSASNCHLFFAVFTCMITMRLSSSFSWFTSAGPDWKLADLLIHILDCLASLGSSVKLVSSEAIIRATCLRRHKKYLNFLQSDQEKESMTGMPQVLYKSRNFHRCQRYQHLTSPRLDIVLTSPDVKRYV